MILDLFKLTNKKAVVTGGAQGIGRAFVEALGEAGASVAIFDINVAVSEQTTRECQAKGLDVRHVAVDVRNQEQVVDQLNKLAEKWGCIDIAVNNVGIGANSPAEITSVSEWQAIIETNLTALFLFAQAIGNIMLQQKFGNIINTASMSSVTIPQPQKQAAYNTSKAGVVQLTKSLACEWAARGVRVNCISPGIVETDLINTEALKSLKSQWISQNPFGRLATVDDLKGAIIYLASDASIYMNGHNLVIDGGHSL